MQSALAKVPDQAKEQAYVGNLGFIKSLMKRYNLGAAGVVALANRYALAFGCAEVPALSPMTVGKMGLRGTPGLVLEAKGTASAGRGRSGGGGGGRGGRGGFGGAPAPAPAPLWNAGAGAGPRDGPFGERPGPSSRGGSRGGRGAGRGGRGGRGGRPGGGPGMGQSREGAGQQQGEEPSRKRARR